MNLKILKMMTIGRMLIGIEKTLMATKNYTANLFTAKTAGFHCVRFLTVVSLYLLQSLRVYSGPL